MENSRNLRESEECGTQPPYDVCKNLLEKIAIVSGNSRGIAKQITEDLRNLGYSVPDISRTSGYDLMKDGIDKLFNNYPECEILVNSCGGMGRSKQEDWKDCMQKNYGIALELTMHYLPKMLEKGFGRVITISSICGLDYIGLPWFNAAKAAQIALNCSLARTYNSGVTFNTICPGNVNVREGENYSLNPKDVSRLVLKLIHSPVNGEVIRM